MFIQIIRYDHIGLLYLMNDRKIAFENQTTHIKQTFNVSLLFSKLSNPLKFEYQGCFCGS